MAQFNNTPSWFESKMDITIEYMTNQINNILNTYKNHRYLPIFTKHRSLICVILSNELEGTNINLPMTAEYQILDQVNTPTAISNRTFHTDPWLIDGNSQDFNQSSTQLQQHLLAYNFLMSQSDKPLSLDIILKTHFIMTEYAVEKNGTKFNGGGKIRTELIYNKDHLFLPVQSLSNRTNIIINKFNEQVNFTKSLLDIVHLSSQLFYDMITEHPFINANGRLSQLLIMYVFRKFNIKFGVILYSNYDTKQHYFEAIQRMREHNDLSYLNYMLLYSLFTACKNFENNCNRFRHEN